MISVSSVGFVLHTLMLRSSQNRDAQGFLKNPSLPASPHTAFNVAFTIVQPSDDQGTPRTPRTGAKLSKSSRRRLRLICSFSPSVQLCSLDEFITPSNSNSTFKRWPVFRTCKNYKVFKLLIQRAK
ncbi:hypothetical protein E1B28_005214 [Marasmius oreades]|uniref:Uncharacterized protein n=1 Tax=Marasmius oreades TaxID=181124 RepID=A0A9P8ADW4_9AGAR|nr:uncharacterized protein E1B28_005214 [Marasmius oreades]KAG7097903.1 hypothetical protein E1B28_005214 [Marasmius oreades]